ncbi:hypothetical protein BDQ17DRAFT_1440555 [Cyathus striatus]|nr:hypothetical protein BDQ17DRAFT_1440555 [Cyathus striatus]
MLSTSDQIRPTLKHQMLRKYALGQQVSSGHQSHHIAWTNNSTVALPSPSLQDFSTIIFHSSSLTLLETINIDGTLKDASEIVWYNDRDDEAPLSSVPIFQVSSPLPKEKGKEKAIRHSDHTVKPTQCVLDMKNQGAASGTASSLKRSRCNASGGPPGTSPKLSCRAKKSTIVVLESDHGEKTDTDIDEGSIAADMGSDLTYAKLRAMGDVDSQKSPHRSKEELTAGIRTVFQ